MAAANITIIGTLTHQGGTQESVTLEGAASLTGLGVGGGPVVPGAPPPGIWPPGSGIDMPAHPIAPGGRPPGIWPPGSGIDMPTHPIVLPEPPDVPEVPPDTPPSSVVKDAPVQGWGYYTDASGAPYAAFRTEKQPK